MGFYRIFPTKDTWITQRNVGNDVSVRATGSNHGRSPALNVFAYEPGVGGFDVARSLLQFAVTELSGKIYDEEVVPTSGVSYMLKMFNMEHADTVAESYDLFVFPLSRSWDEGNGIDDDNDRDGGVANWEQATSTADWAVTGSDFLATGYGSGSQHFDHGQEDLEMDITDIVMNWLTGSIEENGLLVKLGDSEESGVSDYFRKVFHGRETKYIDRMPYIEARWDSTLKDNRGNFAYGQESTLYLYNFVRGELVDLTEPVNCRLQDDGEGGATVFFDQTATRVSTGVYSASFNVTKVSTMSSSWTDTWSSGSDTHLVGEFTPLTLTGSQVDPYDEFDLAITNLKRVYSAEEEARLIVSVRKRDFVTHVGSITSASLGLLVREREYVEKMYYSVENDETGEVVVPFGTGSVPHTQLSYNGDGNYFNLFMKNFVPGFKYRMKFLIDINRFDRKVIDDDFTFKVV